jgi:solute carrier family 35 protein E1
MKVTPSIIALAALCCSVASAFGLQAPRSSVQNQARNAPAFVNNKNPAMVQPINVDGTRGNSPFELNAESASGEALSVKGGGGLSVLSSIDIPLLAYFFFWYVGNYYYNISNKLALKAAGGSAGFPMTISGLQLAVGCLYAMFLWVAPDARAKPQVTVDDIVKMLPVAFCAMGAHSASVFALSAGAVSFGQIVKSAEPAFAAVLSQFVYNKPVSKAKWLCLPVVIGGVILASVKELDFAVSALVSACIANLFAAFKGNENKKLMETEGLRERIGSVGNQFALTTILAFLMSVPLMILKEGSKFGEFIEMWKTTPAVSLNLIASGLYFYGYNELATMTLKKTGAVTQSVANTAKRVIVIVGVAIVLGESLDPLKLLGCAIGIGGVFLYTIIDQLVKPKEE